MKPSAPLARQFALDEFFFYINSVNILILVYVFSPINIFLLLYFLSNVLWRVNNHVQLKKNESYKHFNAYHVLFIILFNYSGKPFWKKHGGKVWGNSKLYFVATMNYHYTQQAHRP